MKMRNSGTSKIIMQGDVHVATNIGYELRLKIVRHILDLWMNLLSRGVLNDNGYTSHFAQRM